MNRGTVIDEHIIADVCRHIVAEQPVRCALPHGGRIHIDRPQPFVCVYRRPVSHADQGTDRLLVGQASYILASGEASLKEGLACLVTAVADTMANMFGSCLVVELWAVNRRDMAVELSPSFCIAAPKLHAPGRLLETFAKALLQIKLFGQSATVDLNYVDNVAPPGCTQLIPATDLQTGRYTLIGLAVEAVYRDADSGAVYPFDLKMVRHGLGRALKKVFYAFSHEFTSQRPAHYHELGRRAMTKLVARVDQALAAVGDSFDVLLHVTPVNSEEAWQIFKRRHCAVVPEFQYRPRSIDPARLKRRLFTIPIDQIEDPTLAYMFEAKRDELDRMLTMLSDRGSERFLYDSLQVYGGAEVGLVAQASELLERIPAYASDDGISHAIHGSAFVKYAEKEMGHYRGLDSTWAGVVELRSDVPGLMVVRGNLLVGKQTKVAQSRIDAALAHEIGTHLVTFHNGCAQAFQLLHSGMAGYEALQEGLAVLSEYLVGGLSRSRLRQLAGRVLAVSCLVGGASFLETFNELHKHYGFGRSNAFNISMRVYRGGGFTKDAVYLRGLLDVLAYLAKGGDIELLLLGKVNLDYLPLLRELRWRQVLKAPVVMPRHFNEDGPQQRLKRLREGASVMDLIEG